MNHFALLVSVLVAFFASFAWYSAFGKSLAKLNPSVYGNAAKTEVKEMLLELLRNVVLALVIAHLLNLLGTKDIPGAIGTAIMLWIGFPVILLAGSVLHEKVPVKLAAIHAGDWLIKLILLVLILSLWT